MYYIEDPALDREVIIGSVVYDQIPGAGWENAWIYGGMVHVAATYHVIQVEIASRNPISYWCLGPI